MPFVWPSQFQSLITLYEKLRADCCASLGHLGFKKENRAFFGPDGKLRDRCRQQLLGVLSVLFSSCCKKNQSLHHLEETTLSPVVRESGMARVSRVTASTDPPDTRGEHQPGHSHCTRERKLKEEKMKLFPRLLIANAVGFNLSLCSCFHSQEALPFLILLFFLYFSFSFFFFFGQATWCVRPH